jgi:predicted dehydrogenase
MTGRTLGIGFIGSGFITRFHLQSMVGVRHAEVRGIWSPTAAHAKTMAGYARELEVGACDVHPSIEAMVQDPAIQALWICGPNHKRVDNMEAICRALAAGKGTLLGVACEKPLGRTVAEAKRMLSLAEEAGLRHAYLEDQVFIPAVQRGREILWKRAAAITGRPYLARAAEEHSGPHRPWFWQGPLQGGGVLNDMMCHSVEVARYLLTDPDKSRSSVKPLRVTARIASLKWSRPEYAKKLTQAMGREVDYANKPAEDFASATIEFKDEENRPLLAEVTTSWSYVGAGLRLTMELLGPEYSLALNSLDSGLRLFMSREVKGKQGEDLVEKQNADVGLMPLVPNEASEYGYERENRSYVRAFLKGEEPELTFREGVEVMELLMTAYMSAEQGRTLNFPPDGLEAFVPAVARGAWKPTIGSIEE